MAAPGSSVEQLRVMVADGRLARTDDPFVVLAHAATIGPATERAVHAQLCRIEYEMAAVARPAPGVEDALAALAGAGTRVTVVSSVSTAAVRSFLVLHGLTRHVRHIAARGGPDRAVLPPAPNLISSAIRERAFPVESCVFVASSEIDLAAGDAAGVRAVRYRVSEPVRDSWFSALSVRAAR